MSVKKERTIAVLMRFVITPKDIISIITLMNIQEKKNKNRQIFERFWGFKMSVEGGSDLLNLI